MPGPDVLVSVPVALGGDALSGNNAAIAAIGLVSMVAGYLLLAALWYFVFRQKPEEKEAARREQEARDRAAGRLDLPDAATPQAPLIGITDADLVDRRHRTCAAFF